MTRRYDTGSVVTNYEPAREHRTERTSKGKLEEETISKLSINTYIAYVRLSIVCTISHSVRACKGRLDINISTQTVLIYPSRVLYISINVYT